MSSSLRSHSKKLIITNINILTTPTLQEGDTYSIQANNHFVTWKAEYAILTQIEGMRVSAKGGFSGR